MDVETKRRHASSAVRFERFEDVRTLVGNGRNLGFTGTGEATLKMEYTFKKAEFERKVLELRSSGVQLEHHVANIAHLDQVDEAQKEFDDAMRHEFDDTYDRTVR